MRRTRGGCLPTPCETAAAKKLGAESQARYAPAGLVTIAITAGADMTAADAGTVEAFARDVRFHVFRTAAETARVPQPRDIAAALHRSEDEVADAVRQLAQGKVLILAPNSANIWAANPFCAVPSGFRVHAAGKSYWGICIWDALGICAALLKERRP